MHIQIPENKLVWTEIFKVNATDLDAGPHGEVTYKITDGGKLSLCFFLLVFFFLSNILKLMFWRFAFINDMKVSDTTSRHR